MITWQLSHSLDRQFCLAALDEALAQAHPDICNTDQGARITVCAFTQRLEDASVRNSMDGRDHAMDSIFILRPRRRLWRSLKCEDIYLHDYITAPALKAGLERYFTFYNYERSHQSLDYAVPGRLHQALVRWVH